MATQLDENTQYIDESTGELLNNGYIYIGLDGLDAKLNPKSIYSDRALSVTLSNPQRIGADGRALNKIWIDGKYSLKVEDSGRNQKLNDLSLGIITQDNNISLINVQGTNSLTADASTALTALTNNQVYILTAANTNTGAMTLTIDLTPTWPIKKHHDQDMQAGDIEVGQTLAVIFNETDSIYELMTNSAIGPVNLANDQTITGVKTFTSPIIVPTRGCLAYSSVALTYTTVNKEQLWDSEFYDTDGIHDTSSNTGRLTVPTGVTKIRLTFNNLYTSTSVTTYVDVRIYKNGVSNFFLETLPMPSGVGPAFVRTTPIFTVVAGDYFQLYTVSNDGTTTLTTNAENTSFGMEIIE
jgi:hypothetical protein